MKKAVFLLVLLAFMAGSACADNNPLVTVNENGQGTLDFGSGNVTALTGVLQNDPGPGGLANVLTYNLLGPPSLTAGDLLIFDGNGTFGDVVRFNDYNTGGVTGYPASLLFYSNPLDGYDSLADISAPPSTDYANVLDLTDVENNGMSYMLYTPTDGQPGFVPGFSVTYDIISDVPEASTLTMLGSGIILGLAGVLLRKFNL